VPELPEVETERGRLAARIEGRRIGSARIDDERLTRPEDPAWVAGRLAGERVAAVERRGKYLLIRLDSGDVLVVHLRMTGSFRYEPASHERAVLELDEGARIAYRDLRRFGTWVLLEPDEAERYFGNIYADEALWHARIHPLRPAGRLTGEEIAALHKGVRTALRRGIRRQGADLGDGTYAGGRMQHEFRVYGRTGESCDRCGTPIEKTRAGGRGTWFCPRCQV
jgi:formamidopyrimidine-DNA glycosylase